METLTTAKSYFAIEAMSGETSDDVARLILKTAEESGLRFVGLECLSTESFGMATFFRFRTDLPDVSTIIDSLWDRGRGVIQNKARGGFMLRTSNGRSGSVSGTRMYGAPRQNRVYRGTAMKFWEEQFGAS
jgi:hypothetical protein